MKDLIHKHNFIILSILLECLIILFVSLANLFDGILYALFYNLIYGLIISVIFPLYYVYHLENKSRGINKNNIFLGSLGLKKLHFRQYCVILFFVVFSIGGQLIPLLLAGEQIEFHLLKICIVPLIMTTFFEEFMFRGFLQTRLEKQYGKAAAILLSGLLFSLYHIGYQGFRSLPDLLLLFAVGIGFALAYKLSDNNLIAVYFVNLPNAFLTYILKSEQFPVFTETTPLFALITIVLIEIIIYRFFLFGKRPEHN